MFGHRDFFGIAHQAVNYVLDRITATNLGWQDPDPVLLGCLRALRSGIDEAYAVPSRAAGLQRYAWRAQQYGCGNCGEMARAAAYFLFQRHIFPIEILSARGVDHEFVCIGRDGPLELPEQWGAEAVICDPWFAAEANSRDRGVYRPAELRRNFGLLTGVVVRFRARSTRDVSAPGSAGNFFP